MKKLLIMVLALQASFAMASYTNFLPAANAGIDDPLSWPGGVYPSGSVTGVVTAANTGSWIGGGFLADIALRQEGGWVNGVNELALRGGADGSGITTVYEIDADDYESIVNLSFNEGSLGRLTLWSRFGEDMVFSILRGNVQVEELFLAAWSPDGVAPPYGTINMRDGILHAGTNIYAGTQFNMLDGGTGNITIDNVGNDVFDVNFETGSQASFTIGSKLGGTAAGVWEWTIADTNAQIVSINGVINTNLLNYRITPGAGVNSNSTTIALRSAVDISDYDLFLGQNTNALDGVGYLAEPTNYESGTVPDGTSSTGLILQANNVWADWIQDFACRLEGGTVASGADFAMRGGSDLSGITTVFEIDALDYTSVTNLDVGSLTLWSQYNEDMELSIFRGSVEVAGALNLISGGYGTINMGDGILHAPVWTGGDANVNMLAGGDGEIVVDDMNGIGVGALYLNFETDSEGSFTFGASSNGVSAEGIWEWMIDNGHVSVDGAPVTSQAAFQIVTLGDSSTISLPGPLSPLDSYLVWAGGFGLTDTNTTAAMTADPDGDGSANLSEYGMLGDPTNKNVRGTTPTSSIVNLGGTNYFIQVHYERTDKLEKGLSYYVDGSFDLVISPWTNTVYFYGTDPGWSAEFDGVTNFVPMQGVDQQFLRLRVGFEE